MTRLNDRLARANQRFEFTSEACGPDTFAVVRMQGFEAISKPYRFELVLVSDEARLDLAAVLAAGAHFGIHAPDDARRTTPYAGMLAEFDQLHQAGGFTFYRAVLVPRLWQLSLYRNSEVYLHEQTIPEIVEGLLKSARLHPGSDYQLKLTGNYRARSYVCQYQETPLDFISRWLEKEGIYYHFAQVDGRDRLVLLDDRIAQAPEALAVNYRPADELDTGVAPDSVQAFLCRARPLPARVLLQDFNHRRAGLPLVASAEVSASGLGEEMIYGENFRTPEEGERYARLRAQELLCGARVFHGEATAVSLRAGAFMELSHHYRQDFDGRYLVTEIRHEGSQAGALLAGLKTPYNEREGQIAYRNSFVALPAGVQFRPGRGTPKPRVAGTMNATIDAEGSGDYAELDAHGQYRVQIPFDRTDKAAAKGSAPIRMATPYAGSDHGMHFPLHKGAEVLLSFADGDPDQPVIVGAVPNSLNESVVNQANPHDNLITTRGGNQVHMSDTKGKEVIWLSSPFHDSSIGIGSVDPKGGGSIYTATKGGSDSVSFGTSNSMSFGANNSLSLGANNSISGAFTNSVSWGTGVSINASNSIDWKMNAATALGEIPKIGDYLALKNLSINDAGNISFVEKEAGSKALESLDFASGVVKTDSSYISATTQLRVMRGLIGAYTALNFAQSAAFSMAVNASDDGALLKGKAKADKDQQDRTDRQFGQDQEQKKQAAYKDVEADTSLTKLTASLSTSASTSLVSLSNSLSSMSTALLSLSTADGTNSEPFRSLSTSLSTSVASTLQSASLSLSTTTAFPMWNAKKDIDKKFADAAADQASPMNRKSLNGWPGIIGKFTLNTVLNVAAMAAFQGYARSLAGAIKNVKTVSRIKMDASGIVQTVNDTEAPAIAKNDTECEFTLKPNLGARLKVAAKGKMAALNAGTMFSFRKSHAYISAEKALTIRASKGSIFNHDGRSGLFFAKDQAKLKSDSGAYVEAKGKNLTIGAPTISIGDNRQVDAAYSAALIRSDTAKAAFAAASSAREAAKKTALRLAAPLSYATGPLVDATIALVEEAQRAVELAQSAMENCMEELDQADAALNDALQNPVTTPMMHGLTIDSNEASLKFGVTALKASNQGLAMSFGSAGMKLEPIGVSVDGSLIKLG